jgi:hypothetical protein
MAIRLSAPPPDYSGKSLEELTGERIARIQEILFSAYIRTMPEAWAAKATDDAVDRLISGINEARAQIAH